MPRWPRYSRLIGVTTVLLAASSSGQSPQDGTLQDGPAGYTIACVIRGPSVMPDMRACAALGAAQRCEHELDLPSQGSREATGMTFANRSDQALKVYWLTFTAERQLYHTIPPGGHVTQRTFIGHNWIVTTAAGRCIGIYNAAPMSIAFF